MSSTLASVLGHRHVHIQKKTNNQVGVEALTDAMNAEPKNSQKSTLRPLSKKWKTRWCLLALCTGNQRDDDVQRTKKKRGLNEVAACVYCVTFDSLTPLLRSLQGNTNAVLLRCSHEVGGDFFFFFGTTKPTFLQWPKSHCSPVCRLRN